MGREKKRRFEIKGDRGENGWILRWVTMQRFSIFRIILSSTSFKKLVLGTFLLNLQFSVHMRLKFSFLVFL